MEYGRHLAQINIYTKKVLLVISSYLDLKFCNDKYLYNTYQL